MKKITKVLSFILCLLSLFCFSGNTLALTLPSLSGFKKLANEVKINEELTVNYQTNQNDGITPELERSKIKLFGAKSKNGNDFLFTVTITNNLKKLDKFTIYYYSKYTNIDPKLELVIYGKINDNYKKIEDQYLTYNDGNIEVQLNESITEFKLQNISDKDNFSPKPSDTHYDIRPNFFLQRIEFTLGENDLIKEFTTLQTNTSLSIKYVRTDTVFDITSYNLRFGKMISKTLYENLVKIGATEFGVSVKKTQNNKYQNIKCHPVLVNEKGIEDENGNYLQFACLITDIPADSLNVMISGKCYVKINNEYFYTQDNSSSVITTANKYLQLSEKEQESFKEHLDVLKYIGGLK